MGKTRVSDKNLEDSDVCSWDTTPIGMRSWLKKLPEHLEDIDPDLVLWWTQGAVMNRSQVCGPTVYHTVALRDDNVREHTFDDPIGIDVFTEEPLDRGTRPLSDNDLKSYGKSTHLCRMTMANRRSGPPAPGPNMISRYS